MMTMESMFMGNACQSGLVPALLRAPLPSVPPSLGMKHFLPFPLDGGSTLSLIPSFSSERCGRHDRLSRRGGEGGVERSL
ncbi:zinc finger protein 385D-like, partial [Sinocyclocheilus grahami]|uniref:zinc finger protein 385D-like n=1 Tax=Sinocyclocheilus grahami TaxID=75366 RepID=UPI0007AC8075